MHIFTYTSTIPLSFKPPLCQGPQYSNFLPFPAISESFHSLSKSHVCFTFSPSNNSNYEREEVRWLREQQRWLREEQRWLREESRWNADRESLLTQISALKLQIQELERQNETQGASSVPEKLSNIATLLQMLKKEGGLGEYANQIAGSGSSAVPLVVEAEMTERDEVVSEEEVVVKEVIRVSERDESEAIKEVKKRTTLRTGSEGDEVRAMQEALQKLGFYSGEEDMEYASFSSGTERAVKTWQASLGAPENGVMTSELLERLYMEQKEGASGFKEGANGAAVASITEISEIQQRVVIEGVAEAEVSGHRVFLLGENRWEDPSRLAGKYSRFVQANSRNATTKCLSCRGEGRLLCTECDGTGEPNIEPQVNRYLTY